MALYLCGQKGFGGYRLGAGWLGRAGGTKVRERERERERETERVIRSYGRGQLRIMGEAIVQTVAGSPPITIACHTVRWLLGARWIRQMDIYIEGKRKNETDDLLVIS